MTDIHISHIVSLYTKRDVIPVTLESIKNQEGGLEREIILVDDNSKDDTVKVADRVTVNFPKVRIITNEDNKGPSVRLNQGAKVALGKYLHFLDHDDVLPTDAIKIMYDALEETRADIVYGRWEITDKKPIELLGRKTEGSMTYTISNKPLDTVLDGRFKRMCVMVKKDVFEAAGGFDPEIFIQDESLPLRLAAAANKLVVIDAIVNLVPKGENNLSENKTQLNHDRFMAYYNFYKKHKDIRVYRRAISAAWKQRRKQQGAYTSSIFFNYLISRYSPKQNPKLLERMRTYITSQPGVLRP